MYCSRRKYLDESMGQFLNTDKIALLNKMFQHKPVGGKYYIPIGLQELKLAKVEKKETKRPGLWMYVVEFRKNPEWLDVRVTKASFKPIKCFHIMTDKKDGSFNRKWFKAFTTDLSEDGFLKLKEHEGEYFQALVKQKEKMVEVNSRIGSGKTTIRAVENEIMDVFSLDERNIEVDYLSLYEELSKRESESLLSQTQN